MKSWGAPLPSHLQRTGWPFQKSSSREFCLLGPATCFPPLSQFPPPMWSLLPHLGGGGNCFPLGGVGPWKHTPQAESTQ